MTRKIVGLNVRVTRDDWDDLWNCMTNPQTQTEFTPKEFSRAFEEGKAVPDFSEVWGGRNLTKTQEKS